MERNSGAGTPIPDEDFRRGLIEIGKRTLPAGWIETWANQLVQTVPVETRPVFLDNEIEPVDMVSDLSDEEIANGI